MATILHPYMHSHSITDLKAPAVLSPLALLDSALKQSLLAPTRPPAPSGLLSLPPELILAILELLTPPSLLATSYTCSSLHQMAYSIYLVRVGLGPQCGHLMLFNDESPKSLGALNGALFKPALGAITCVLQTSSDMIVRARKEFDELKMLLGKLTALNEFHLDFIDFKTRVTSTPEEESEVRGKRVTVDVVKEVAWILDAVVALGCKKMTICLLGMISTFEFPPQDGRFSVRGFFGMKSHILGLLPARMRIMIPALQQESQKPNHLEAFHLHSSILLEHPFFNWTVDVLNHSRITTLSVNQMSRLSASLWAEFLSMLHLPGLTTLLVDVLALDSEDAFDFLERHSKLEKLHIGTNVTVFCPFNCHPEHEAQLRHKLLPNLTSLSASPSFLAQLLSSPEWFPKLRQVAILETIKPGSEFSPDQLRSTLSLISPRLLQLPEVQLTLSFRSQFSHVPITSPGSTPLADMDEDILARFTHLELQIHVYRLSEEAKAGLPSFLGIFPGLKYLEFTTLAKAGPVEAEEWPLLVKEIWVKCPALQMVGVNADVRTVGKWL